MCPKLPKPSAGGSYSKVYAHTENLRDLLHLLLYSEWRSCPTGTLQPPATRLDNLISLGNRVGSYSGMKKSFGNLPARHPREKGWYPRVQSGSQGSGPGCVTFPVGKRYSLLLLSCEPGAGKYSVAPCTASI